MLASFSNAQLYYARAPVKVRQKSVGYAYSWTPQRRVRFNNGSIRFDELTTPRSKSTLQATAHVVAQVVCYNELRGVSAARPIHPFPPARV